MLESLAVSCILARPGRSEVVDRPTAPIYREFVAPVSFRIQSQAVVLTSRSVEPSTYVNIDGSISGEGHDIYNVPPTRMLKGKIRAMGKGPIVLE
jgi:hypothetical protein